MRYNRGDFSATAKAAKRLSENDGRLRFVFATAGGYAISLKRLEFQDCWWTNGKDCGLWDAYAKEGRSQWSIAREHADKLFAELSQ